MKRSYFIALEQHGNNGSLALSEVIEQLTFNPRDHARSKYQVHADVCLDE